MEEEEADPHIKEDISPITAITTRIVPHHTSTGANEKTKYQMGNKGAESYRKVKEELLTKANTKYGADMAHIILKEEEPPFPPIKLAKPRTTLADINAAKDEATKKELEAQRELETAANLAVFNQRNND